MSALAIGSLVVIGGLVWGGFAVLLARAIRSEGRKPSG